MNLNDSSISYSWLNLSDDSMRTRNKAEDDQPLVSAKLASPSALRPPHVSLCFLIRIFAAEPQALKKRGLQLQVTPKYLGRFSVLLLDQIRGEDDIRYPPLSALLSTLKRSLGQEGEQIGNALLQELQVRFITHPEYSAHLFKTGTLGKMVCG